MNVPFIARLSALTENSAISLLPGESTIKMLRSCRVAFALAYRVGIHFDTLNPSKTKKHGRRAKSLFKYGLTYIAGLLFSGDIDNFNQ